MTQFFAVASCFLEKRTAIEGSWTIYTYIMFITFMRIAQQRVSNLLVIILNIVAKNSHRHSSATTIYGNKKCWNRVSI